MAWLVASGALKRRDEGWQLVGDVESMELPAGMESTIQGRLDLVPRQSKNLLRAASAMGQVFWEEACAAMGFEHADARLADVQRADFVIPALASRVAGAHQWSFRNAMVRQVAYQMLPAGHRQPVHRKIARWLEEVGETDAALLAHHFEEGGDLAHATDYQALAGARALADGDPGRSADWFEASLRGPPAAPELARRILGLTRAQIHLGRYDAARDTLEGLRDLEDATTGRLQIEARMALGRILLGQGDIRRSEEVCTAALEAALEAGHDDLAFDIQRSLFWAVWGQGRYEDLGRLAEELQRQATGAAASHPERLCSAQLAVAFIEMAAGDLSAMIGCAAEAVELSREVGHPYHEVDALIQLGYGRMLVGSYAQALEPLQEAAVCATRLETAHHLAASAFCRGHVALARRQVPEALRCYQEAMAVAEPLGDRRTLSISLAGQARALCVADDDGALRRAAEAATRAVEVAEGMPPVEAAAHLSLALVRLEQGQDDEAVAAAQAAVAFLDRFGTHEQHEVEILLAAHDAWRLAGRGDEAERALSQAQALLEARAGRISDPGAERSFRREVPHNRRVLKLCAAGQ